MSLEGKKIIADIKGPEGFELLTRLLLFDDNTAMGIFYIDKIEAQEHITWDIKTGKII